MQRPQAIRIAIIDLYNRTANEGMRAMGELLQAADGRFAEIPITVDVFETRFDGSVPDRSYDLVLSSGGPGSPFEGEGTPWEAAYFSWLDGLMSRNAGLDSSGYALFICHSFQMMVRHFEIASVTERKSESFGVFPVHLTEQGVADPFFAEVDNPFFAADFRHWQVVQPREQALRELGASVLAVEKARDYVPYERATMAIRISPELVGVQFHPEADPPGMSRHFRNPDRKKAVLKKISAEKYARIMHRMESPEILKRTHDAIIPGFIERAIRRLRPECFEGELVEHDGILP